MTLLHNSSEIQSDGKYYSQDDQAELQRLQELSGLGEALTDGEETDELIDIMSEVGLEFKREQ